MNNPSYKEQDIALLQKLIPNHKIFMDTCSFMNPGYKIFEKLLFTALKYYHSTLIVPFTVYNELIKNSKKNISDAKNAQYAISSIEKYYKQNLIDIRGESGDSKQADNVFQCQFSKFRIKYNLVLVTQDIALAHDLLALNDISSQRSQYTISVYRLTQNGSLMPNKGDIEALKKIREPQSESSAMFTLQKKITALPNSLIEVHHIPQEGDTVELGISKRSIRIGKQLGAGGEGIVYETSIPHMVCKIYRQEKVTRHRLEKLRRMLSHEFNYPGICWPKDVILNQEKKVVGYLMPAAKGVELRRSIFIPPLLLKKFPDWTRTELAQLAITILKKIVYLNHNNIIIGDINGANILVVSSSEVYFVDTDSYQIEDFPCPVGTPLFTARELQGVNLNQRLRTHGNERFAIATLLFMLMLPGKAPYAQQDGDDPETNIKKMDFSYPFGEHTNKKTPDGPWRFCWSHLSYELKGAFYQTFRYDGKSSSEQDRLSASDWLHLFEKYHSLLASGKFQDRDPESGKIFPTRFKIPSGKIESCKLCGQEYDEDDLIQGYCKNCLYNKGVEYTCKKCGKPIFYSNYCKIVQGKAPFTICRDCYQHQSEIYATQICSECHQNFTITNGEKDFYDSKGWELPKRCPTCRELKKNTAQNQTIPSQDKTITEWGSIFSQLFNFFKL